jgi:hypothetical protein
MKEAAEVEALVHLVSLGMRMGLDQHIKQEYRTSANVL